MARIPPEEPERLKAEVSVEQLVTAAGVDLKAAGKGTRRRSGHWNITHRHYAQLACGQLSAAIAAA